MSRPPRPHGSRRTHGDLPDAPVSIDYLPLEFPDLVTLQEELAADEILRAPSITGPSGELVNAEGDFGRTLMELSAIVGHVLGVYQDRYAGEAFLSTATAASSLVRHAQRLAYERDPGLAATGYLTLYAKADLVGTVAAGLGLASVPKGEQKAQDFETLDDLVVDARLNQLLPVLARTPVRLDADLLAVEGTGLRLKPGDTIALVGALPGSTGWVRRWSALTLLGVAEDASAGTTTLTVAESFAASPFSPADADPSVAGYAEDCAFQVQLHPRLLQRSFGWNADPSIFPPNEVQAATTASGAYSYEVFIGGTSIATATSPPTPDAGHVFLAEELKQKLQGSHLVQRAGGSSTVVRVAAETAATIALHRASEIILKDVIVKTVESPPGTFTTTTSTGSATSTYPVTSTIAGTVTALSVEGADGARVLRSAISHPATFLGGWDARARVVTTTPNKTVVAAGGPLQLPGAYDALVPGRLLLFSTLAEDAAQVVRVIQATVTGEGATATTLIRWEDVTAPRSWEHGNLQIFGNVAQVSHGRAVTEVLGSSDGVTPFQRFTLKQSPLTLLPGAVGVEPAITVRVNGVAWGRVADFWDSGPDDRHFRLQIDERSVATVQFGDGRNGAVPAAGSGNVEARYRVGLGTDGNVEYGRLTRVKKAHPLLSRAFNHLATAGGAAPASTEDIRTQATRYIRTFDRAVSVSDHADLALLFGGVARASAIWDEARGLVLVAATADGQPLTAAVKSSLRAWLDDRRDTSVPLVLDDPSMVTARLAVAITPDPAWLVETVRANVRLALTGDDASAPGLFTFAARDLGQPAFLSEVSAVIEAVEGVVSVEVLRFEFADAGAVHDVLRVRTHEWISLDAADTRSLDIEFKREGS